MGSLGILLNQKPRIMPNIFQKSTICQLGITFLEEGREFSYDFWYDDKKKEYPYGLQKLQRTNTGMKKKMYAF